MDRTTTVVGSGPRMNTRAQSKEKKPSLRQVRDIRARLPSSIRRKSDVSGVKPGRSALASSAGELRELPSNRPPTGLASRAKPQDSPRGSSSSNIPRSPASRRGDADDTEGTSGTCEIRTAVVHHTDGVPLDSIVPLRKSLSASPLRRTQVSSGRSTSATTRFSSGTERSDEERDVEPSPPPSPEIYQFSSVLKYVKKSQDSLRSSDDEGSEDDQETGMHSTGLVGGRFDFGIAHARQASAPIAFNQPSSLEISNGTGAFDAATTTSGGGSMPRRRPRSAPLYAEGRSVVALALSELHSPVRQAVVMQSPSITPVHGHLFHGNQVAGSQIPLVQNSLIMTTSPSGCRLEQTRRKSFGMDSAIGLDEEAAVAGTASRQLPSNPSTSQLGLSSSGLSPSLFHNRQGSSNSSGLGSRTPSITSDMSASSGGERLITSSAVGMVTMTPSNSSQTSPMSTHSGQSRVVHEGEETALPADAVSATPDTEPSALEMTGEASRSVTPSIVPKKMTNTRTAGESVANTGLMVASSKRSFPDRKRRSDTEGTSQYELDASDSCNTLTEFTTSATEGETTASSLPTSPAKRTNSSSSRRQEAAMLRRHLSSASTVSAAARLEDQRTAVAVRRGDKCRLSQRSTDGGGHSAATLLDDGISPELVSLHMSMSSLQTATSSVTVRDQQELFRSTLLHGTSSDTLHQTHSGVFCDSVSTMATAAGGGQQHGGGHGNAVTTATGTGSAGIAATRPRSLTDELAVLSGQNSSHDLLEVIEEPAQTPPATPQAEAPVTNLDAAMPMITPMQTPRRSSCTASHSADSGSTDSNNTDTMSIPTGISPSSSSSDSPTSPLSMPLTPLSTSISPDSSVCLPEKPSTPQQRRRSSLSQLTRRRSSLGRRQSSPESIGAPTQFHYIGRVKPSGNVKVNQKLVSTRSVELHRPASGTYGFYVKRRPSALASSAANDSSPQQAGFFVSRIASGDTRKLLSGMLEEGDQILAINGVSLQPTDGGVAEVCTEDVVQLLQANTLQLVIIPRLEIEEW